MYKDKFPSVHCCTTIVPVFLLAKAWQITLKTQLPVQTLSAAAHTPHFYDTRSSQLFIALVLNFSVTLYDVSQAKYREALPPASMTRCKHCHGYSFPAGRCDILSLRETCDSLCVRMAVSYVYWKNDVSWVCVSYSPQIEKLHSWIFYIPWVWSWSRPSKGYNILILYVLRTF